jgi:hypothetical protein
MASHSSQAATGQPDPSTGNDLLELLQIAWRRRRFILAVTAAAGVASVVISLLLMPDYFKSSVTFYPSNPTMTDRSVMFGETVSDVQIDYFGGNSDIDRILTLAQTSGTVDYIINRYKLFDHYGYDTTSLRGRYKTKQKFLKNYNTRKTVLGAVEIAVWDTDKELAAEMANHIALTVDDKNREMLNKERLSIIDKLAERGLQKQQLVDSLSQLVESGTLPALRKPVVAKELEFAIEDLNNTRRLHEQYLTSVNIGVSTINITEPAFPAIRKDKPKRSLVCLGYTSAAFIASLLLVVLVEKYRQLKPLLHG